MHNLRDIRTSLLAVAMAAAALALYRTLRNASTLIVDRRAADDSGSDSISESSVEDDGGTNQVIFRTRNGQLVEGAVVPSDSVDESAYTITRIILHVRGTLTTLSFAVLSEDGVVATHGEPPSTNITAEFVSLTEGFEELSIPSSSDLSIGESLSSEQSQDEETIIFEDQTALERTLRFDDVDAVILVSQEDLALLLEATNTIHVHDAEQLLAPTHEEEEDSDDGGNDDDDDGDDDDDEEDIFDDEDASTRGSNVSQ